MPTCLRSIAIHKTKYLKLLVNRAVILPIFCGFLACQKRSKGLSARQAEALVKTAVVGATPAAKKPATAEKSADIKAIEQRAAIELGLAMSINWNEQAEIGRVQIDCQSLEQMTLILEKLGLSYEG